MGKDKKFLDAEKNVASSIFQKRHDYEEAHKEEEVVIEEVEVEKKLISPDNFGGRIISNDVTKYLDIERDVPVSTAAKAEVKFKTLTEKEIKDNERIENEKVDIFAGLMTRGGELKPSLKKEEKQEEELIEEKEEEDIDYSYDITAQFHTRPIKPIDKSPKK